MNEPRPQSPQAASLRERAEKFLREPIDSTLENPDAMSPETLRTTLHELRVHQIELEMQNEELRRAQTELDASRTLYFNLYDLAPLGYCTVSDNGLIVRANLMAATLLGTERSGLIGKRFSSFIKKNDGDVFYLLQKRLVETGEPQVWEMRIVRPDGVMLWLRMDVTTTQADDGLPLFQVVLIDITRRKQSEEDRLKLQTAVEQSANTVVITDPCGNIEYVNPAFEKSTGYSAAEALGKNPRVLKSGSHDAVFYESLWAVIRSGRIWRGQIHNRRKDGSLYWESATISPVLDGQGEIAAFIAIKEDITDRKAMEDSRLEAMERTEAANRAKSEFLAIMSHELRTPLNGVLGFAELLAETSLNEEQLEFARIIGQCGNHLLQIVNDILDFSSIEKGHIPLESAPVGIAGLVELSVVSSRKTAEDKGLELRYELDPGLPKQITGDERRIRQILINLIGNAVKFTLRGAVVVRVEPSSLAGRPALDFSVMDSGLGIHAETIGLLFKPFVQEDMTLHRPYEGTGLGLAISQRLAEAMGGSITVVSVRGQGSIFTLRLPLDVTADTGNPLPTASSSDRPDRTPVPSETNLLLVVEDDPFNSDLAGKMLISLGFRAEFAFDGQQAVDAYRPGKFSAILMDMQMPVMDGLTAAGKIRELEGASGARVPIIAMTANVMPGDRERCLVAGMDDFLTKPYSKAELAAKVAGVVCSSDFL